MGLSILRFCNVPQVIMMTDQFQFHKLATSADPRNAQVLVATCKALDSVLYWQPAYTVIVLQIHCRILSTKKASELVDKPDIRMCTHCLSIELVRGKVPFRQELLALTHHYTHRRQARRANRKINNRYDHSSQS